VKLSPPRVFPWTWARRLTALSFLALLVLGGFEWFPWFKGSTSATEAFGLVPFVDPLAALEVTLATRAWMPEVMLGAAILVAAALLFGPVFCGWVCPLGLILDLGQSLRRLLRRVLSRLGVILPDLVLPRGVKLAVLALALVFSAVAGAPLFLVLSPINAVARAATFAVDAGLILVVALIVIELFAPRLWCRSLCPLGALYGLIGRRAPLRIHVDPAEAGRIRCQRCEVACPMGIPVMGEYTLAGALSVDHPDCTRCGACIEVCPRTVLRLGVKKSRVPATGADRADVPDPERCRECVS